MVGNRKRRGLYRAADCNAIRNVCCVIGVHSRVLCQRSENKSLRWMPTPLAIPACFGRDALTTMSQICPACISTHTHTHTCWCMCHDRTRICLECISTHLTIMSQCVLHASAHICWCMYHDRTQMCPACISTRLTIMSQICPACNSFPVCAVFCQGGIMTSPDYFILSFSQAEPFRPTPSPIT